jgi:hypothetical protein
MRRLIRPVEHFLIGAFMAFLAFVIERRLRSRVGG